MSVHTFAPAVGTLGSNHWAELERRGGRMRGGHRRRSRSPLSDAPGGGHRRRMEDIDEEMVRRKRAIDALREISERARRSKPPDTTRR